MATAPDPGAQREVIEFLGRQETYGPDVESVTRIDTHGAIVFLAGDHAYKLKRAVRFPYMDYSTAERRRTMCEAELRINRRTAPMLYERVAPITRGDHGLRIGGDGPALDWLVIMRRFDQAGLFDRLAAEGRLTPALIAEVAAVVAAFHRDAEPRPDFGGASGLAWVVDGNRAGLDAAPDLFDVDRGRAFDAACRSALAGLGALLDARRDQGYVRHCHGDLHLRNICLIDGRPVLFDAIEFNDKVANIDTMYDFAFLLMDLERRALRDLGNVALNAYLDASEDYGGVAALPLFLACRAGVRAQVAAPAARAQTEAAARAAMIAEARDTLDLAAAFLSPAPARLVAVGGLSGSGKSTVARLVAPSLGRAPGAVVLRSDVIRKRLAGVGPTTRLEPSAYSRENAARVYDSLVDTARRIAASGQSVVVDAVFARPEERDAAERAARAANVPFLGVWLEAPAATLAARIDARRGDASDATVGVLRRQLDYELGMIRWRRVDASGTAAATADAVLTLI